MSVSMLDRILMPGGLTSYAQPIVRVGTGRCKVASIECLTRGPIGTPFESPLVLFEYARLKKAEAVVDRHAVGTALAAMRWAPPSVSMSVNVHASTLGHDTGFVEFLIATALENRIEPGRIIVEIVEHSPALNAAEFLKSLCRLRESSIRIALDDVGTGQSNYRMILDARPDCFKLDAYLVQGVHADNNRRAVLDSIIRLAKDMRSSVIAEGVETAEDLLTLLDLGVTLIQGYLFHKAVPTPELLIDCAKWDNVDVLGAKLGGCQRLNRPCCPHGLRQNVPVISALGAKQGIRRRKAAEIRCDVAKNRDAVAS
jgi:EAL domain-containing protein (putative c-di-GMP-specific phosphodiesterase class I)